MYIWHLFFEVYCTYPLASSFLAKLKLNNSNLLKFSTLTTIIKLHVLSTFWRKVKQSMFEYCSYINCSVNRIKST